MPPGQRALPIWEGGSAHNSVSWRQILDQVYPSGVSFPDFTPDRQAFLRRVWGCRPGATCGLVAGQGLRLRPHLRFALGVPAWESMPTSTKPGPGPPAGWRNFAPAMRHRGIRSGALGGGPSHPESSFLFPIPARRVRRTEVGGRPRPSPIGGLPGRLLVRTGFRDRKRVAAASLTVWAPIRTASESSGRNQPGAGAGQTILPPSLRSFKITSGRISPFRRR